MSTARQDVVDYLRLELSADFEVLDTIAAIEHAKHAVVMVSRSSIARSPVVETRDDELSLWLLSPYLDIAEAEADLDENLDELLAALERHEFLHWDAGERDVFADAYHAFRVTVTHRTITKE